MRRCGHRQLDPNCRICKRHGATLPRRRPKPLDPQFYPMYDSSPDHGATVFLTWDEGLNRWKVTDEEGNVIGTGEQVLDLLPEGTVFLVYQDSFTWVNGRTK